MAYVNIHHLPFNTSFEIKKTVYKSEATYLLGRIFNPDSPISAYHLYIAKLDSSGIFLWQRSYICPESQITGGSTWDIIHCSDIVEIPNSNDIIILGYDKEIAFLLRLNENGSVMWGRKFYDLNDTPLIYDTANFKATLDIFENTTLIVHLQENHNSGAFLTQVNHKFYTFNINGYNTNTIQTPASSPIIVINDRHIENNLLTLYGDYGNYGCAIQIDQNLNIVRASYLNYTGTLTEGNFLSISAASTSYNGNIMIMGSFAHIDLAGSSFKNFFVAKIPTGFTNITVIDTGKDFITTTQTITLDDTGIFFSLYENLYCMDHNMSQILWTKKITLPEINNLGLAISNHTDGKITSFYRSSSLKVLAIAQAPSKYQTCRTSYLEEPMTLSPLEFEWVDFFLQPVPLQMIAYPDPIILPSTVNTVQTDVLCPPGIEIIIDENSLLQSSNLYLQAAGSQGTDSTEGIHLRWLLKNNLQTHLPKGNLYQAPPQGHNKPNDYVEVFRAPYEPVKFNLSFNLPPHSINDTEAGWLYRQNGKTFFVYFRNLSLYQLIRNGIDPFTDPIAFFNAYGNNLIEVESSDLLFFNVWLNPYWNNSGTVKIEILSVEENAINQPKNITYRDQIGITEIQHGIKSENGKSIRFVPEDCLIDSISFDFYRDAINKANLEELWQPVGKFGLSLDDSEVFQRVDPDPINHPVHGKWLRYNDGEYVNIPNYFTKWNGPLHDPRQRIKDSVERYVALSADPMNPLANEIYFLNDAPNQEADNGLEISNLMVLQMASLDYHIARMLGLGILDLDNEVLNGEYIYIARYYSFENNDYVTPVNHLYMSLPTSIEDQRLPLPVQLKEPMPGIISATPEIGNNKTITDAGGYTHDGKARFISLFIEELTPDEPADSPFFYTNEKVNMASYTYPVYVGIKYKDATASQWQKPELPHDSEYFNISAGGTPSFFETVGIAIPEIGQPAFVHKEGFSGSHIYSSYGVNWFSRAVSATENWSVETQITPKNDLLPPSSINALLIQEESPLFLTSENEQNLLKNITNSDKTFVRLVFEYNADRDMVSYQTRINGKVVPNLIIPPEQEELFADEFQIFFSPEVPEQLFGTISNVTDLEGNPLIAVIESSPMVMDSTEETILFPTIDSSEIPLYIGSALQIGGDEFIIQDIEIPVDTPLLPKFFVLKKQVSDAFGETSNTPYDPADFIVPAVGKSFMFTRNMLNSDSWGTVNSYFVPILIDNYSTIHSEEITIISGEGADQTSNSFYRRFRGVVVNNAVIKQYTDSFSPNFAGLYEIVLPSYSLGDHPQFNPDAEQFSVQWYRGTIRIPYQNNPDGERKILKIIRFYEENGNLIIYAQDEDYETEPLQFDIIRTDVWANFYPGYRVYIYSEPLCRLTENYILPQGEDSFEKYSVFGLRSSSNGLNGPKSPISTPTLMFARKFEQPQTPQQPKGALYATRPDYFGRSTYTFTTQYLNKPFSLSVCRTNDDILLSSLYIQVPYGREPIIDSVEHIKLKNNDEFVNDRLSDLANVTLDSQYLFPEYNNYRFPIPNNRTFFDKINRFISEHNSHYGDSVPFINPNTIGNMNHIVIPGVLGRNEQLTFYDFVKQTIVNSYVPLTETPMIYQYIKSGDYIPIAKPQTIRDRNGNLLKPTDPDFDIAPMMKIIGTNPNKTLFTDFTLDGASTSNYFYAVRETDRQMKHGALSPAIGPVKLVNSFAVKTPEIKSVIPILENEVLGISPAMQIQVNSYDAIHNVTKINLYRALNMGDATSVRSMTLIKTIDLETVGLLEETVWTITDDFTDLDEVPFGDPLYYRVTVESKIEYAEPDYNYDNNNPNNVFTIVTDFVPSEPSKLLITTITENVVPDAPVLSYTASNVSPSTLGNVVLKWNKQAYKGKYYLYKMSEKGNWKQIAFITTNDAVIEMPLEDTDWESDQLFIQDTDHNTAYHHFKVVSENTAGMSSTNEVILTIPS